MCGDLPRRTVYGDCSAVGQDPLGVGVPDVDVEHDHGRRVVAVEGAESCLALVGAVPLTFLGSGPAI